MLSRRNFLISIAGAYYGGQGTRGEQFPLQIIVVKTQQSAEAILEKLRSGASFEALARQYSIVPSARDDGYIGQIEISSLPAKFRTALQGLRPGQVSGLIKTDLGYVIIKVTENAKSSQLESAGQVGGCTEGSLDRGPESRREEWGCGKRIRTRWVRILDIIPACAKNRSRLQPNRRYCLKSIPNPPPKCSQPWEASRLWCRRSARWACRGACSSTSGLKSARGVMTKRRSSRVS